VDSSKANPNQLQRHPGFDVPEEWANGIR